jgi:hypothetical protein
MFYTSSSSSAVAFDQIFHLLTYCCIGLQQFQSGVSIDVDYFCLLGKHGHLGK